MSSKRTKPLSFDEKRSKVLELFHESADNLVCMEKIGSSNYYWSFTSSIVKLLDELRTKKKTLEKELEDLEKKIAIECNKNVDNEARRKILKDIDDETLKNKNLKEKQLQYIRLNPDTLFKKKRAISTCKAAVNRWTENILTIRTYCRNTFNIDEGDFNKQFGIPQDIDFIE